VSDDANREPSRPKQRKCPICGKPATKENDPFCSKRCAQVDLNRWLSGVYVIPAAKEPSEDELKAGD
jgi:endogenous inhibitor of DNA gyrase (YacG/DUF329 family)